MKVFAKIIVAVMVIAFMIPMSSCSKKTYSSRRSSSSTIDPVTRKSEPVRKTYMIPAKKKKILGQNKPKIHS